MYINSVACLVQAELAIKGVRGRKTARKRVISGCVSGARAIATLPDRSGRSVQQVDHVAAGLLGSRHGFLGEGKWGILAAELQFAIDIEIPGPATAGIPRAFELYPDQLVAIPEQCLPHCVRRVSFGVQQVRQCLPLSCQSVRYYHVGNIGISLHIVAQTVLSSDE